MKGMLEMRKIETVAHSIEILAAGLGVSESVIEKEFKKRGFAAGDRRSFKSRVAAGEINRMFAPASK
jgi:hypothetical protein